MAVAGTMVAHLAVDRSQFDRGINDAKNKIKGLTSTTTALKVRANVLGQATGALSGLGGGFGGSVSGLVGAAGVGGGVAAAAAGVAALVGVGTSAFRETNDIERRLRQTLRASGEAAGLTFDAIKEWADARAEVTNFDDTDTIKAASVLGTFTNIKGDNFLNTLEAAQDLATVFETDLSSSATMLGKALQDPEKGLAKLAKAVGGFSDAETDRIKSLAAGGDVAGAQKAMLEALSGKGIGGQAEAGRDPLTQLWSTMGDLAEVVGAYVLPMVNGFADVLNHVLGPFTLLRDAAMEYGLTVVHLVGDVFELIASFGEMFGVTMSFGEMLTWAIERVSDFIKGIGYVVRNFGDLLTQGVVGIIQAIDTHTGKMLPTALRNSQGGVLPQSVRDTIDAVGKITAKAIEDEEASFAARRDKFAGVTGPAFKRPDLPGDDEEDGGAGKNTKSSSDHRDTLGAFEAGTKEAFDAIRKATTGDKDVQKKQLAVHEKELKETQEQTKIETKMLGKLDLIGGLFGPSPVVEFGN